jgi:hypothetical protein
MSKKLEELFELDSDAEEKTTESVNVEVKDLISKETLDTIERVDNALPQVRGLDSSDSEMDEIAGLAKESFNNLMDLGMQVDSRFSAEIFAVASNMLGHAITAKTAKMNKKLKMIDLQLKKAELDRKISITNKDKPEETPLGTGSIVDRNELIKMIMSNSDLKSNKKDK